MYKPVKVCCTGTEDFRLLRLLGAMRRVSALKISALSGCRMSNGVTLDAQQKLVLKDLEASPALTGTDDRAISQQLQR